MLQPCISRGCFYKKEWSALLVSGPGTGPRTPRVLHNYATVVQARSGASGLVWLHYQAVLAVPGPFAWQT